MSASFLHTQPPVRLSSLRDSHRITAEASRNDLSASTPRSQSESEASRNVPHCPPLLEQQEQSSSTHPRRRGHRPAPILFKNSNIISLPASRRERATQRPLSLVESPGLPTGASPHKIPGELTRQSRAHIATQHQLSKPASRETSTCNSPVWRGATSLRSPSIYSVHTERESRSPPPELDDFPEAHRPEDTMKTTVPRPSSPFKGLPDCTNDLTLEQSLIDDDSMRAFGIQFDKTMGLGGATGTTHGIGILMTPSAVSKYTPEASPAKDSRPGLHVAIPPPRESSKNHDTATLTRPSMERSMTAQTAASIVSPQSAHPPQRAIMYPYGSAPSQTSIVSPISAVDPHRPRHISSLTLKSGADKEIKPSSNLAAMQSANSTSSTDTGEPDGQSPGLSERSSMSSVSSDVTAGQNGSMDRRAGGDSTHMRVDHDTSYAAAFVSKPASSSRPSTAQPQSYSTRPKVRRKASSSSMQVGASINMNKPLPPEPPEGPFDSAASSYGHSYASSRASTITPRQRSPHSGNAPDSMPNGATRAATFNGNDSTSIASKLKLRSRFSPQDAEAFEEAQRWVAESNGSILAHSLRTSPSASQVSLVLEPIHEHAARLPRQMGFQEPPLQMSRGPMRMEPSRKPPQPPVDSPQRHHTVANPRFEDTVDRDRFDKRSMTRSATSAAMSLSSQPRRGSNDTGARVNTGTLSKANRILGKTDSTTSRRRQPTHPAPSQWDITPSPSTDSLSGTGSHTPDGTRTPETKVRPDAHFEEIRKRLELLSPKHDPSASFMAFHQKEPPAEKTTLASKARDPNPSKQRKRHSDRPQIAELDADPAAPLLELEGSAIHKGPAELATSASPTPAPATISSTAQFASIPIPPIPEDTSVRRGRPPGSSATSMYSTASRSVYSNRSIRARSFASLAASDIPDIYAGLPTPPEASTRPSLTPEEMEQLISAEAAELVLLHILESLDNLEDLFAAALVSRGFYRTFKRNELHLLKRAIYRMSPAAWELREMSVPHSQLAAGATDYTPKLYFRHYVQDLLTMVELKAMILESCKSFLRQDTILALAGETERSPIIDEAFWRVWTFCRIFGCGTKREDDIMGQMDWLEGGVLAQQSSDTRTLALTDELARNSVLFNPPAGFARGNGKGLTSDELYDMIEIWTCLGVLIRGYHGKRQEAREFGIFDSAEIPPGDAKKANDVIEEWTFHLLTLAPPAILDVTCPTSPTKATFAHAQAQGYTHWQPPMEGFSRSTFLKEAVSRVYEAKLDACSRGPPRPDGSRPVSQPLPSPPPSHEMTLASRQRVAAHAAELRALKQDPTYRDVPVSDERPMSNYRDVLSRLDALSTPTDTPPLPQLPHLAAQLSAKMPKITINSPTRSMTSPNRASFAASSPGLPPPSIASVEEAPPVPSIPGVATIPVPAIPETVTPSPPPTRVSRRASIRQRLTGKSSTKDRFRSSKKKDQENGLSLSGRETMSSSPASSNSHMSRDKLLSHSNTDASDSAPEVHMVHPPRRSSSRSTTAATSVGGLPASALDNLASTAEEKVAISPGAQPLTAVGGTSGRSSADAGTEVPRGPQVRDPVDLAVDRLVAMGFDEVRAKRALAQTESGHSINFNHALTKLKKEREKAERLERLKKMG